MESIGLSEKSKAFQYAILCNKISQILKKIEAGTSLSVIERNSLGRGAKLLQHIVEGSILVEGKGKMHGFSASQEGLSAYGHALSAIKRLNLITQNKEFTDLFLDFHKSIVELEKNKSLEKPIVDELKMFFTELSEFFSEDIQRDLFGVPKEQKITSFPSKAIHHVFA
jgi:hypothetical protein